MTNSTWRIILIAISLFFVWLIWGCSTTSKIKSVTRTRTDSTATARTDYAAGNRTDSSGSRVTVIDKTGTFEKETVYVYRPGRVDSIPVIQTITIREKGTGVTRIVIHDTAHITRVDTVTVVKDASVSVKKDEMTKDKSVKRTSYWGWLWLILALVAGCLVYRYLGRIKASV